MPIDAPNLDDLTYAEIVERAKQLIPVYCPEWTNFNDADPGMTLVQLFAWMTEMTIYRLNRVPDKTYIHFLNFIGEERKPALPAVLPVTFLPRNECESVEIPPFAKVATRQRVDPVARDPHARLATRQAFDKEGQRQGLPQRAGVHLAPLRQASAMAAQAVPVKRDPREKARILGERAAGLCGKGVAVHRGHPSIESNPLHLRN